jgi:hypothetical protein
VFDRARSQAAIRQAVALPDGGVLVTDRRSLDGETPPDSLALTDVDARTPAGTTVTVTVESDPDVDGDYEDVSDSITLDGSGTYDVSGLSIASKVFRLRVELDTDDETTGPSFDGATLSATG